MCQSLRTRSHSWLSEFRKTFKSYEIEMNWERKYEWRRSVSKKKKTLVLRIWGFLKGNLGLWTEFITGLDQRKDLKMTFRALAVFRSNQGLTLETSVYKNLDGGQFTFNFNSVDEAELSPYRVRTLSSTACYPQVTDTFWLLAKVNLEFNKRIWIKGFKSNFFPVLQRANATLYANHFLFVDK